jgi:Domain of unknown function (DUF3598)
MGDHGKSWDRFISRHLGDWTGRSLAVTAGAKLISAQSYHLSTSSVAPSKANPSYILLSADITPCEDGPIDPSADSAVGPKEWQTAQQIASRYDIDSMFVFEDGSFTSDSRLLSLGRLLPREAGAIPFAIELALMLSATERVRVFIVYDSQSKLESICLAEETREGLFENRPPLAFTSLVGAWNGISETLHRPNVKTPFSGFGKANRMSAAQPVTGIGNTYSKEDLPPELRAGSAGKDGLLRLKSSQVFSWDPTHDSVRRVRLLRLPYRIDSISNCCTLLLTRVSSRLSFLFLAFCKTTVLRDMSEVELGSSTVYGKVDAESGSMFDLVTCSDNTLLLALSNGCYVSAPVLRARGIASTSEFGCLVTPNLRRRISRTYSDKGLASESLVTEALAVSKGATTRMPP